MELMLKLKHPMVHIYNQKMVYLIIKIKKLNLIMANSHHVQKLQMKEGILSFLVIKSKKIIHDNKNKTVTHKHAFLKLKNYQYYIRLI